MRARLAAVAVLALAAPGARAGAKDAVFDLKAVLAPPLRARVLKTTEKEGIVTEEVRFHSETDGGKDVEIFAYFSYPRGAKRLPAFVWNQGGLAQASSYWTEFGARRGYAALCIDFPMPGYRSTGGYAIVAGLELPADPRRAPIYHGAVALLRAVAFLESRPEVDRTRIGMAGSSWGGFYTTLMAGVDPRLKACSSMFGCGGLQLGNVWWDGRGPDPARDRAFRERWRTTLDPAWRLPHTKAAIAWFTGTNDTFYWLPAVDESYRRAGGPRHLSLLPNWDHALTPRLDEQVFAWLDVYLKGKPAFLSVGGLTVKADGLRRVATWTFAGPGAASAAELLVSYGEAGNWRGRYWQTVKAAVDGRTFRAELPASGLPAFVSGTVIDRDGFRYSTGLLRVGPVPGAAAAPPDYDGCSEWGDFEEGQLPYLRLHGLPVPGLSKEAKSGKQAAVLKAGETTLPPIHATAGVPHHFRAYAKADRPTAVTLRLAAPAGARHATAEKRFEVGAEWTELSLEFTPPADTSGSVRAVLAVPAGASVLLDQVTFRPIRPASQ